MAELQDSGSRREFESGAVRDIAEGKGRCDLLPLDIIGAYSEDFVLETIGQYLEDGDDLMIFGLICDFSKILFPDDTGKIAFINSILDVSKHYEDGAKKYGEHNWEKGIPCHSYIDSAVRHYLKYLRGDTDERHDRAFIWNLLGLLWTIDHHPELNDLPYNVKE